MVGRRFAGPLHLSGREGPVVIGRGVGLHARVERRRATLVGHDVLTAASQHEGPRDALGPQGDLVGHRARRDEHGDCLAHPLGKNLLEPIDRRVLAVPVVSDLSCSHGPSHRRGGTSDRVAWRSTSSAGTASS